MINPQTSFKSAVRFVWSLVRSRIAHKILTVNALGLFVLLIGILSMDRFREGLVDAEVQALITQGRIIAAALTTSYRQGYSPDSSTINLDDLVNSFAEQTTPKLQVYEDERSLIFAIDPEQVAPILPQLISLTDTRARIYDTEGFLILDSRQLLPPSSVEPQRNDSIPLTLRKRITRFIKVKLNKGDLSNYTEPQNGNGLAFPEVKTAMAGQPGSIVRINKSGEVIVSVAVPMTENGVIRGAILLSTEGDDIDQIIYAERLSLLKMYLGFASVILVISLLLSGTIALPLRRLAGAATRTKLSDGKQTIIPDFSNRNDEIGDLSASLREMTKALYNRIEEIERFAADVSHEIKNPLTSIKSATETLQNINNPDLQKKLFDIIAHDIRRIDRLITDVSDASRIDAELQRENKKNCDLKEFLQSLIEHINISKKANDSTVTFHDLTRADTLKVPCYPERLSRVILNIVDNARSFSLPEKTVSITLETKKHGKNNVIVIHIDDEGRGISADPIEKIFSRFYTDRPDSSFGNNSGLGLAICQQIIKAHNGMLEAKNRTHDGVITGARFTITLPLKATEVNA